jgi:DNA-binding response OmpR family regulator
MDHGRNEHSARNHAGRAAALVGYWKVKFASCCATPCAGRRAAAPSVYIGGVKVLVVEDDRKVAAFLARVLSEEGYVADLCASGSDALAQAGSGMYGLCVVDWMLPGIDGLELVRRLRAQGVTTPILMLSARADVRERVLGLNAGADDYLAKPFDVDELVARVHALLRRAAGHAELSAGPIVVDQLRRVATLGGRDLGLTQRELALLVHLMAGRERVVTRSELLRAVWATSFDPESNVVEVHMSRLRAKLGRHGDMIDTVRGRGYRLRLPEAE